MPKLSFQVPKYRRHKSTGRAFVVLGGTRHYLGKFRSPESLTAYQSLLRTWLDSTQQPAAPEAAPAPKKSVPAITLQALAANYNEHCATYYRKNGQITREAELIVEVLKLACEQFADLPADQFGPACFDKVRQVMIAKDWSRNHCNKQADRLRRCLRWGVSTEQLSPGTKYQALLAVPQLAKGRTAARETDPVECVPDGVVERTIKYLPAVVADMVRLQRLTSARPGEVCKLRPVDLDRSSDVWVYTPDSHKTEHHNKQRKVCIGPKAQQLLMPYLLRPADSHCFSPEESERKRRAEQHDNRTTPLSCGNKPGSNCKRKPKRTAGDSYTVDSYRKAIHRAADKAGVQKWSPNQLRHSGLTEIRSKYGLEAAQVVAGHSNANVTQVYAERDLAKAIAVARQVG